MPQLSDRPVLVTGAAGAIGAAVCRAILDAGGGVIGCDLQPGEHVEHVFDVTTEEGWRTTIERISASGRGLAGLVNAAGVFVRGTIAETDRETFARVIAVNLDGTFLGCKHAMPLLARHGGSIVNLSSIFGRVGRHDMVAYAASKGGVDMLTRFRRPARCTPDPAGAVQLDLAGVHRERDAGRHGRRHRLAGRCAGAHPTRRSARTVRHPAGGRHPGGPLAVRRERGRHGR